MDIGNQRRRHCRGHRVGFRKQLISGHPPKKENTSAGASVVKYQILLAHSVMNHDDSLDRHDFEKTTVTLKNIFKNTSTKNLYSASISHLLSLNI